MRLMKEEEFFAPRPKILWELRLFRASAFGAAAEISLIFLLIDWAIITGPFQFMTGSAGSSSPTDKFLHVAVLTLIQVVLILPCWRAWLFHHWACYYVLVVWLGLSFLGFIAASFFETSGSASYLVFLSLTPIGFLLLQFLLLIGEGHRLKAGF